MSKKELFKRYVFFIMGLFVSAFGVSLITKAQLGTSPISSVPYVLSMGFVFTMGVFTFLLNMVLIIGQLILQRKDFSKIQLIQIPISVIFGCFIDLTMSMLSFVNPKNYIIKMLFLLIGCIILALGISMEIIADVVMLSGEAFVKALADKINKDFGTTKIFFDITLVVISCFISLVFLSELKGVREGTIIAALIVGLIARFFNKILGFIEYRFFMDKQMIV